MDRITFLVDGFNLYHSIREAGRDAGSSLKWLDLGNLCSSYVRSNLFGKHAKLEAVEYFSAYATFLSSSKPGVVERHRTYVAALRASGVRVRLARFKWKPRWCPSCKQQIPGHEEKETDVAIAVRLVELFVSDACDIAVLVTGDTDLLPAIRAARRLRPDKPIWVAFPYRRVNNDLRNDADGHFRIRRQAYARHQFPDPLIAPNGTSIRRPSSW